MCHFYCIYNYILVCLVCAHFIVRCGVILPGFVRSRDTLILILFRNKRCSWRLAIWHSPLFWFQKLLASLYLIYMSRLDCFPVPYGIARENVAEAWGREAAKRRGWRGGGVVCDYPCLYRRTLQDKLVACSMPLLHSLYLIHMGRGQQWSAKKPVAKKTSHYGF